LNTDKFTNNIFRFGTLV